METFGLEGGTMHGAGGFLPCGRTPWHVGWLEERLEQEAEARLDHPTSESSQARKDRTVPGGSEEILSRQAR